MARSIRGRSTLFLVAVLIGSTAMAAACGSTPRSAPIVVEPKGDGVVAVGLRNYAFEPQTLVFKEGSTVEFHLQSTDILHSFTVRDLGINWMVDREEEPQVQVFKFDRPGEYRLICVIPGHSGSGMVGTIEVR